MRVLYAHKKIYNLTYLLLERISDLLKLLIFFLCYFLKGSPCLSVLTTQRKALTNKRFCVASMNSSSPCPIFRYIILYLVLVHTMGEITEVYYIFDAQGIVLGREGQQNFHIFIGSRTGIPLIPFAGRCHKKEAGRFLVTGWFSLSTSTRTGWGGQLLQ